MIDALKELITLVQNLPGMALWILGGFLFYKLFIAGSIVAAIVKITTMIVSKYHDAYTKKLDIEKHTKDHVNIQEQVNSLCIQSDGSGDRMLSLLRNLRWQLDDRDKKIKSHHIDPTKKSLFVRNYLHRDDVDWLERAIHERLAKDLENQK